MSLLKFKYKELKKYYFHSLRLEHSGSASGLTVPKPIFAYFNRLKEDSRELLPTVAMVSLAGAYGQAAAKSIAASDVRKQAMEAGMITAEWALASELNGITADEYEVKMLRFRNEMYAAIKNTPPSATAVLRAYQILKEKLTVYPIDAQGVAAPTLTLFEQHQLVRSAWHHVWIESGVHWISTGMVEGVHEAFYTAVQDNAAIAEGVTWENFLPVARTQDAVKMAWQGATDDQRLMWYYFSTKMMPDLSRKAILPAIFTTVAAICKNGNVTTYYMSRWHGKAPLMTSDSCGTISALK